ncbi:MAG: DegT/DnrJ/EryC1/StrS family aminotransferase [Actinobacteria bacterium]|nr:DegT/DnrJ/EryC1/StrS family aminotransferase [Actinomycetota bacterium]
MEFTGELVSDWPIFDSEEIGALQKVLEAGEWGHSSNTGGYVGNFEPRFERDFADLHTSVYGLCVANGTVAIQLALEAVDIGVGDDVIVPGLTWQATAGAVLDVNAVPILVDVEPDTYCLDPDAVEAAITPRTKAVIAVHLYNSLADLDRLTELCRRHDLSLIEDCAHSHGSTWRNEGVGSVGDVGCFSFQSSKSLTSGEGGFCLTNREDLFLRLDALRNCGRVPRLANSSWQPIQSGNYRMTEFQAAVLSTQLGRFPEQLARREANARRLDDAIETIEGLLPMVRRPQVTRQGMYAYAFRFDQARFGPLSVDEFRGALAAALGIRISATYEPLNHSPFYQPQTKRRHRLEGQWEAINPGRFEMPVAERAFREESVVIPHEVLLSDWEGLSRIPEAALKLQSEARN